MAPATRGLGAQLRSTFAFLESYRAGAGSKDLERLFRREAADAYRALTRDQEPIPEELTGARAGWERAKRAFLGLSYQLSPPRRLLFALALVLTLGGACNVDVQTISHRVSIGLGPASLVAAVAILVLLLALELVDRLRVRDELEVARQLQRELLPEAIPPGEHLAFAHSYRSANEVGGDYYDVRELPDGRLALVSGDASGHGIAAGLLMVIAHATLALATSLDPRPERVLPLLDRALAGVGGRRAFMTLFYGLLDPETGELSHLSAGHPYPLVRRADGRVEELAEDGLPLGLGGALAPTWEAPRTTVLAPGDLLLLYSDGLPEALSGDGESFGFERLERLLATASGAAEAHDAILCAFDRFRGDEPQRDDVSLLVVERRPAPPPPPPPPPPHTVARPSTA